MATKKNTSPRDKPPRNSPSNDRSLVEDVVPTAEISVYPISAGIGATAGGLTGATLGFAVGGPIGEVVGALVGAALGGLGGVAVGEQIDLVQEKDFWKSQHETQPHAITGKTFEDFEPAYRVGYERYFHLRGYERSFEAAEPQIREEYEQSEAVLPWMQVREAARAAWTRVHENDSNKFAFVNGNPGSSLGRSRSSHESVAVRAWFIYEREGFPQDRALEHWLRAEYEQQLHDAIELRAWFIYEKEGYPECRALDHWLRAERAELPQSAAA
jgi:hypothetical protein